MIYRLYLEAHSLGDIQKELADKRIPTARVIQSWSRQVIQNILTNEKYIGDGLRQKTEKPSKACIPPNTPDYVTCFICI